MKWIKTSDFESEIEDLYNKVSDKIIDVGILKDNAESLLEKSDEEIKPLMKIVFNSLVRSLSDLENARENSEGILKLLSLK